jgi:hypothetical protein
VEHPMRGWKWRTCAEGENSGAVASPSFLAINPLGVGG